MCGRRRERKKTDMDSIKERKEIPAQYQEWCPAAILFNPQNKIIINLVLLYIANVTTPYHGAIVNKYRTWKQSYDLVISFVIRETTLCTYASACILLDKDMEVMSFQEVKKKKTKGIRYIAVYVYMDVISKSSRKCSAVSGGASLGRNRSPRWRISLCYWVLWNLSFLPHWKAIAIACNYNTVCEITALTHCVKSSFIKFGLVHL